MINSEGAVVPIDLATFERIAISDDGMAQIGQLACQDIDVFTEKPVWAVVAPASNDNVVKFSAQIPASSIIDPILSPWVTLYDADGLPCGSSPVMNESLELWDDSMNPDVRGKSALFEAAILVSALPKSLVISPHIDTGRNGFDAGTRFGGTYGPEDLVYKARDAFRAMETGSDVREEFADITIEWMKLGAVDRAGVAWLYAHYGRVMEHYDALPLPPATRVAVEAALDAAALYQLPFYENLPEGPLWSRV